MPAPDSTGDLTRKLPNTYKSLDLFYTLPENRMDGKNFQLILRSVTVF